MKAETAAGGGENAGKSGGSAEGGSSDNSGDCIAGTGSEGKEPPNKQQKDPSEHDGKLQKQELTGNNKKPSESSDLGDPDDQEEDEILEESPCKRWSKRREKVKQRDVPGIDAAYLAMDNETGNEVVWNEVLFSERKNFREQEEKIRIVFDHLTRLEHPNLVKFHKYWMDTKSDKPRIIFITEYMSSGSMSRFLQRARSSGTLLNIKAWKSWTRQILYALSYLHSCDPPIVHANLTCNTIFIQQNGLVKIGCVAPNTIHHHVKTFRENIKNIHYLAPEYDHLTETTTQADIYSFGVCALEMATTGALQSGCFNGNSLSGATSCTSDKLTMVPSECTAMPTPAATGGSTSHIVTEDLLRKAVDSLEDLEQKEFIERCLEQDPIRRANVAELLSRLGPPEPDKNDETSLDEEGLNDNEQQQEESSNATHELTPIPMTITADRTKSPPNEVMHNIAAPITSNITTAHQQPMTIATNTSNPTIDQHFQTQQQSGSATNCTTTMTTSHPSTSTTTTTSESPASQLITAATTTTNVVDNTIGLLQAPVSTQTAPPAQLQQTALDEGYHTTQSIVEAPTGSSTPPSAELTTLGPGGTPQYKEIRQIMQMHAEVLDGRQLRVQLQLDDQMNRQLTGQLRDEDTPESIVAELVQHGFVSETNSVKMHDLLASVLSEYRRRELEQAARKEFGDSGQNTQHQQYFVPSGSTTSSCSGNSSSENQSPKHQHQSASVPPS